MRCEWSTFSSTRSRSVTSWTMDRQPTIFPLASMSGAPNHSHVMRRPSRVQLPKMAWLFESLPSTTAHPRTASSSARSLGGNHQVVDVFPRASPAVQPKIRSADAFHTVT
jgi:hypothetical protein